MTDTTSSRPVTDGEISSHGESHTSMSGRKSRGKPRVDTTETFPQVKKSRGSEEKVTPSLPREVTFSGLSLGRPERDPERERDQQNNPAAGEPEPVGPLAEKFLDQLAAQQADHRAEVFARLRRQKPAIRTKEQPR